MVEHYKVLQKYGRTLLSYEQLISKLMTARLTLHDAVCFDC